MKKNFWTIFFTISSIGAYTQSTEQIMQKVPVLEREIVRMDLDLLQNPIPDALKAKIVEELKQYLDDGFVTRIELKNTLDELKNEEKKVYSIADKGIGVIFLIQKIYILLGRVDAETLSKMEKSREVFKTMLKNKIAFFDFLMQTDALELKNQDNSQQEQAYLDTFFGSNQK